jgi:hypothetical protein
MRISTAWKRIQKETAETNPLWVRETAGREGGGKGEREKGKEVDGWMTRQAFAWAGRPFA